MEVTEEVTASLRREFEASHVPASLLEETLVSLRATHKEEVEAAVKTTEGLVAEKANAKWSCELDKALRKERAAAEDRLAEAVAEAKEEAAKEAAQQQEAAAAEKERAKEEGKERAEVDEATKKEQEQEQQQQQQEKDEGGDEKKKEVESVANAKELAAAKERAAVAERGLAAARSEQRSVKKREQELAKKEARLEYRLLTAVDKEEEMLRELVEAKLVSAQSKEQASKP
jgi:hypothetical protein